jgi:hypothetical protein
VIVNDLQHVDARHHVGATASQPGAGYVGHEEARRGCAGEKLPAGTGVGHGDGGTVGTDEIGTEALCQPQAGPSTPASQVHQRPAGPASGQPGEQLQAFPRDEREGLDLRWHALAEQRGVAPAGTPSPVAAIKAALTCHWSARAMAIS